MIDKSNVESVGVFENYTELYNQLNNRKYDTLFHHFFHFIISSFFSFHYFIIFHSTPTAIFHCSIFVLSFLFLFYFCPFISVLFLSFHFYFCSRQYKSDKRLRMSNIPLRIPSWRGKGCRNSTSEWSSDFSKRIVDRKSKSNDGETRWGAVWEILIFFLNLTFWIDSRWVSFWCYKL